MAPPIHDVGDAVREIGKSKHIKTRAQAIAIGLKAEGRSKKKTKRGARRPTRKISRY